MESLNAVDRETIQEKGITKDELIALQFLDYHDFNPAARVRMVSDMGEMYGRTYTRNSRRNIFSRIFNVARKIEDLRDFLDQHRHYNHPVTADMLITDKELDDLVDGVRNEKEIVDKLFHKHFPCLTKEQIEARVNCVDQYDEEIKNLKNNHKDIYDEIKSYATLSIAFHDFNKDLKPLMKLALISAKKQFDNFRLPEPISNGACNHMIENALKRPEALKRKFRKDREEHLKMGYDHEFEDEEILDAINQVKKKVSPTSENFQYYVELYLLFAHEGAEGPEKIKGAVKEYFVRNKRYRGLSDDSDSEDEDEDEQDSKRRKLDGSGRSDDSDDVFIIE